MKVKKSYSEIIYCLLFYFLAVALQAFVTPKIFGTSIRISAADLLLPCLLLGLIVNHVRVEPNRPIFLVIVSLTIEATPSDTDSKATSVTPIKIKLCMISLMICIRFDALGLKP